jgi:hypothetical protein
MWNMERAFDGMLRRAWGSSCCVEMKALVLGSKMMIVYSVRTSLVFNTCGHGTVLHLLLSSKAGLGTASAQSAG